MTISRLNSFFSALIFLGVVVLLAHVCSLLLWQIFDPKPTYSKPLLNPAILQNNDTVNEGEVFAKYPLFGKPPKVKKIKKLAEKKTKKVTAVAPKVTLKLRGILSGAQNYAIIEVKKEQDVYAEKESVSYLYIEKIADDYVIFSDDGIEHKIFVSDESVAIGGGTASDFSSQPKSQNDTKNTAAAKDNAARDNNAIPTYTPNLAFKDQQRLSNIKKTIRKNPLKIIGKINTFPYRLEGRLVGYQVTPGSERSLFKNVGLKAGDIIVSANGRELGNVNTFTEGMKFLETLGNAKTLDLIVNRKGKEQRIYVTLD